MAEKYISHYSSRNFSNKIDHSDVQIGYKLQKAIPALIVTPYNRYVADDLMIVNMGVAN